MDDLETFRLFVDGTGVEALSGRTFESMNPYTGRPWARGAPAGPAGLRAPAGPARVPGIPPGCVDSCPLTRNSSEIHWDRCGHF
jgi:hypothetical protein